MPKAIALTTGLSLPIAQAQTPQLVTTFRLNDVLVKGSLYRFTVATPDIVDPPQPPLKRGEQEVNMLHSNSEFVLLSLNQLRESAGPPPTDRGAPRDCLRHQRC